MKTLCAQSYSINGMAIEPCTRCPNFEFGRCVIPTGAEHLPTVNRTAVPECPIQDRCQHQVQNDSMPCPVRARGMICESALKTMMSPLEAENHKLAFNALYV